MTRGGARGGAGRRVGTGQYGEPTVVIRVPASKVDDVRRMLQGEEYGEPTCPLIVWPRLDKKEGKEHGRTLATEA